VVDAIAERNMSPASCTCPTAKGKEEYMVKLIWWTMLLKRTSLTSKGR